MSRSKSPPNLEEWRNQTIGVPCPKCRTEKREMGRILEKMDHFACEGYGTVVVISQEVLLKSASGHVAKIRETMDRARGK